MSHHFDHIRRVAVLGAGVMGAQIAAHLVNAGVETILFDLPAKEGPKNAQVEKAIAALKKQNPAPLGDVDLAQWIEPANYDEDLEKLKDCDLVIEAIAERLDWKRDLYQKVAPHLASHTILATNTSGLSIEALSDACPADVRSRFCGVHFFNPPRYMHLVELIPTKMSDPAMLDCLETFLVSGLGKGVVRAKDTPNFVANRIGVFSMLATIANAKKYGVRFDVVDDLTGPKLGRPKSATFRTADVVGLDTFAHVVKTMEDTLSDDPWHTYFNIPTWLATLIERGHLGAKTKVGIFKKEGKRILMFDPETQDYVPSGQKADEDVKKILDIKDPKERLAALRASDHPQAQFLWACFADVFHYIAYHLASIADNARDVDFAIRWGFGWKQGPFELWQAAGWSDVAAWLREDIQAARLLSQAPLPDWVDQIPAVHQAQGSYNPAKKTWDGRSQLAVYRRQHWPERVLGETETLLGHTVFENDGVRAFTLEDDGVVVVSFKTKAHTIGPSVLEGLNKTLDLVEAQYSALIIWQNKAPFSVGADLQSMLPAFMSEDWASIERMINTFQQTALRLRYSKVPTIAATRGYVFGGGCEFMLHCDRVVAALESYIGLVEVGVGLLPAGGGCKEFALRAVRESTGDALATLKDYFMNIATAKVATSALEAKALKFLRDGDVVVFNEHELLYVAVAQAKAMMAAGYRAPHRVKTFPAPGRNVAASIRGQLLNMKEGQFISQHDDDIATLIADVMTGGDVEPGTEVTEQWMLDLERKHFMQLLKTQKTQDRIANMLSTGKPLRN